MKNELINIIEAEKEVLSAMPLKTKKNKDKYLDTLNKLETEYTKKQSELKTEIKNRLNKLNSLKENPKIMELNKQIINLDNELYLINPYLDSFEKLGLDRVSYGLNYFYKENLFRVNKLILKAINYFKEVGIELNAAYFDYSHYTYEYMQVFFKEINTDLKSILLRDTFEKIYWQCPDIISHLDLNIKYLYYLNIKKIDKYFLNKEKDFLAHQSKDIYHINEFYLNLIQQKDDLVNSDKYLILKDFIAKKLMLSNYTVGNIKKSYDQLLEDNDYYNQNKEMVDFNIIKLELTLKEYQDYISFRFIIDDIKKKFNEKDSYKNKLKNKLKIIKKEEDKLRKINLKIYNLKNRKNPDYPEIDQLLSSTNLLIKDLKKLYAELDIDKFNDKVLSKISNSSTYYDVFSLALADYSYLTDCIRKNNSELAEDEIKLKVYKLQMFLKSPYNTIINNTKLSEEKDIESIISERYQLLNLNITKEMLNIDNIDEIVANVHNIVEYLYIKKSNIDLDEIDFIIKALAISN